MPAVPSVRSLVEAAADAQVKITARAVELPGKARHSYAKARRSGLGRSLRPVIAGVGSGALRLSAVAVNVPLELIGRVRDRRATPADAPFGHPVLAHPVVGRPVNDPPVVAHHPVGPVISVDPISAAHEAADRPGAGNLPVADYDHLTLASLRARMLRLTVAELLELHAYETVHAARPAVLTMLDNRIAKLRTAER